MLPPTFKLFTQDFTVETWMKRSDSSRSGLDFEGSQLFAGSANGFSFGITHTGRLYLSHVGVVNFFSNTAISDTNWHHVAVTRGSGSLSFYVDGELNSSVGCQVNFDMNGPFAIGGLGTPFSGLSYGFWGSIDELAVYGRALTSSELATIAAAGPSGKCTPPTRFSDVHIINHSFEALTGTDSAHFDAEGRLLDSHYSAFNAASGNGFYSTDALPGWSGGGAAGTFNPPEALFPGGVPDGQNTAWINVEGQVSQTLSSRFEAGRIYHLSVDVGAPAGLQFPGYVIGLYANGQPVAEDRNSRTVPSGGFLTATLAATVSPASPAMGAPIEVRLGIPGSSPDQVDFDNVRLTVESPILENLALGSVVPSNAQPNADFTVSFTVENQGLEPATGVVLSTPLPAGFTLVTNTVSQGAAVGADGTLLTVLGTLPGGSIATVTLTGHGAVPADLVFHAEVTRDGADASVEDNQTDTTVSILGPCVAAPEGLVAWLRSDGNSADELQHTVTTDGSVRYVPGKIGQAFEFDGASEVAIEDSPEFNQSSFTIETWVYPTAVDGTVDIIANKETSYPNLLTDIQFEIGIKGPLNDAPSSIPVGNLAFFLSGVSGLPNNYGGWTDAKAAIPLNRWTHVALTVAPGTVTAYVNGTVALSVDGLSGSPVVNNWPLKIGSRSTIYVTQTRPQDRFNGRIDEFSVYARALSSAEIASIHQAGSSGKCAQTFPVVIVSQPAATTVMAGTPATFSVAATGSRPLTYQWQFNGTNILNATNVLLSLPAPRKADTGDYSVVVCNELGCTNSNAARLTVTPAPALVQAVRSTVKSGEVVTVPVQLVGNGDENAVSFSLRFDTRMLAFEELSPGIGATGAQLIANTSATGDGFVGVAIALPAGTSFPEGTNQLLNLTFRTVLTNALRLSTLTFGDSPTRREIVNAAANPVEVTWANGSLTINPADYEGDVGPRPDGDRRFSLADWVQAGRFVAGLDEASTASSEFQRADSAPLATGGNGLLTVSDWVQAGRFAFGLDVPRAASGPLAPVAPPTENGGIARQTASGRTIRLTGMDFVAGRTGEVAVVMNASGEENALAFSVHFDPAVLQFVDMVAGASEAPLTVNINSRQAADGRIGLAIALRADNRFPAGEAEVVRLRFVPTAEANGAAGFGFADSPVFREVASSTAETLASAWEISAIAVVPPALGVRRLPAENGETIELSWPAGIAGATLQGNLSNHAEGWKLVAGTITIRDGRFVIEIPAGEEQQFFRLLLP